MPGLGLHALSIHDFELYLSTYSSILRQDLIQARLFPLIEKKKKMSSLLCALDQLGKFVSFP